MYKNDTDHFNQAGNKSASPVRGGTQNNFSALRKIIKPSNFFSKIHK